MTKLQKLKLIKDIINELIEKEEQRKFTEIQKYEQRKARGLCVYNNSCKEPVVEGKTLCEIHLRKAAKASLDNFNRSKYYASN